jgi:hypothetical protein
VHQKPADQKKYLDFDGKAFKITDVKIYPDGSIDVLGQDLNSNNGGRNKAAFGECYLFSFSPDGKLLANYGVDITQKGKRSGNTSHAVINMLRPSQDNARKYWFMLKTKKEINIEGGSYPARTVQYGAIDNNTKAMSEVRDLGEDEKKDYYLFNKGFYVALDHYMIYLSETSKGDKILLSRFDILK